MTLADGDRAYAGRSLGLSSASGAEEMVTWTRSKPSLTNLAPICERLRRNSGLLSRSLTGDFRNRRTASHGEPVKWRGEHVPRTNYNRKECRLWELSERTQSGGPRCKTDAAADFVETNPITTCSMSPSAGGTRISGRPRRLCQVLACCSDSVFEGAEQVLGFPGAAKTS